MIKIKLRSSINDRYMQQYKIDYIKEHGEKLTAAQLANICGCSMNTIYQYCKQYYITPTKAVFQRKDLVIPELIKY